MPRRPTLSLSTLTALVALWLSTAFNTAFYQKMLLLSGYHGPSAWLFVLASIALLWAYLNLVFQWLTWGRLARPLLALLLLCSALCTYFINTYGVGIDAGQITNMMETDVLEVRDLLSWQMLAYVLVLGIIPTFLLFRVPLKHAAIAHALKSRTLASALSLLVAGGVAAIYMADYASIFREHREVRHREGLLDMLQRAGYAVTWIDNNSGCKGACARVETWPLPEDLKPEFCRDGECLDGILAPSLAHFLAQNPVQDRVVVLHQAGSHGPAYYRRYPDEFKRFTPTCESNALQSCTQEQIINTYDNTIAYTDHVLATLIRQLAQQSNYQAALLYVSDHGESTGEHGLYLHGAPYLLAPDQQTQVPLLTWFGPDWAARPQASCLSRHMQGLSHDHVFHTVLGWLGVQSAVYNPALDWQRPCRASAQDLRAN